MRRLLSLVLVAGIVCGAAAASAEPVTTLIVPTVPLDKNVPPELPPKIDELLGQAMAQRSDVKIVSLARATASGGVIAGAKDAVGVLAKAKTAYAAFRFADAVKEYDALADLIEQAGSPPADSDTLTAALVGSAMANEAAGQKEAVKTSCKRLMTLRPSYQLDRVRVPPQVVKACEAEAVLLARAGKRTLLVTSLPALAQVYVDGVLRGTTPLSTQIGVGRHGLIVAREDRLPWREVIEVEPGAGMIKRSVDLKGDPVPALAKLEEQLRQRGPIAETMRLATELAKSSDVQQIIVIGVQSTDAAAEGWRILTASLPGGWKTPKNRISHVLDVSFGNTSEVFAFLSERLSTESDKLILAPSVGPGSTKGLDFSKAVFGEEPKPIVVVTQPPRTDLVDTKQTLSAEELAAKKRRRKIGLGVGLGIGLAVVAAGVTVGVLLGTRDTSPQWSFHVDPR